MALFRVFYFYFYWSWAPSTHVLAFVHKHSHAGTQSDTLTYTPTVTHSHSFILTHSDKRTYVYSLTRAHLHTRFYTNHSLTHSSPLTQSHQPTTHSRLLTHSLLIHLRPVRPNNSNRSALNSAAKGIRSVTLREKGPWMSRGSERP